MAAVMDPRCAEWLLPVSGLVALVAFVGGVYVGSWLAQVALRGRRQ